MYKIDFAKQLDKDTANVEIEGEVTFAKDPLNFKSKPEDKKQYDFWSQWIFLRDDTESMGVSLSMGKEEDKVEQGDKIKVRGRIDEWTDRDGVLQKKLMGKIVKAEVKEEETKVTNVEKKTLVEALTEDEIIEQRQIEKRNHREKAVEIASNLMVANKLKTSKELFTFAEILVRYVYNGYKGEIKEEEEEEEEKKIEKAEEKTKLEVIITPDKILKILEEKANLQTWKEVLYYATLADICPVESTVEDIQKILTDNNKLIQKVLDEKKYKDKEKEKERLEKEEAKAEKEGKIKAQEIEIDEYLKEISIKAKGIGLKTWKEIIYFAVKSDVFQPGIDVSEAKERLFQHTELYNTLLEAIEVSKDVMENVKKGGPTDEIPF